MNVICKTINLICKTIALLQHMTVINPRSYLQGYFAQTMHLFLTVYVDMTTVMHG